MLDESLLKPSEYLGKIEELTMGSAPLTPFAFCRLWAGALTAAKDDKITGESLATLLRWGQAATLTDRGLLETLVDGRAVAQVVNGEVETRGATPLETQNIRGFIGQQPNGGASLGYVFCSKLNENAAAPPPPWRPSYKVTLVPAPYREFIDRAEATPSLKKALSACKFPFVLCVHVCPTGELYSIALVFWDWRIDDVVDGLNEAELAYIKKRPDR